MKIGIDIKKCGFTFLEMIVPITLPASGPNPSAIVNTDVCHS
nr:hypothetical protein P5630_20325 [Bacillus subtilis]